MAFQSRKLVLIAHIATSIGFMGAVATFLALALVGLTTHDSEVVRSAYMALSTVTYGAILPLAFASLVIGIVQSLVTPWGLFRHYWVVVKLWLTIVSVVVLMLQLQSVDYLAHVARASGHFEELLALRIALVAHAAGGLMVLLVATGLSVYKPLGMTRYGRSRAANAGL